MSDNQTRGMAEVLAIPEAAVEAGPPRIVQAPKVGCQNCSYNSKYGTIYCKEHRGW